MSMYITITYLYIVGNGKTIGLWSDEGYRSVEFQLETNSEGVGQLPD